MRITGPLGKILFGSAAVGAGILFAIPVVRAIGREGFSVIDGSAPAIGAGIYLVMALLLCLSAPGLFARVVGVISAAISGWACGEAATLAQNGDYRLASGLVCVAVLVVTLAVTVMRSIIARRDRDIARLSRRMSSLSDSVTAHLRDRFHGVAMYQDDPNPLADVALVDRLVNGAIADASRAHDRDDFLRTLIYGLRDVRDSLRHHGSDTYSQACFDEHARALMADIRREGLDVPAHRRPAAPAAAKGQTAH